MLSIISYIPLADIPWKTILWPGDDISWVEKIVRPLLVYLTLLVIFRIANKREMASATMFDFLIILLLSNVVQNAMIGNDNSILGATAGAVTLILLSGAFNFVTARSRNARNVLEGEPVLLVKQGRIDDEMMKEQKISRNDLLAAIRKQGIIRIAEVAYAVLEIDGSISVIKKDDDARPHDCLPVEIAGRESADNKD
jgi:uncharacterized membrane protein YcaP (DUF421 family)